MKLSDNAYDFIKMKLPDNVYNFMKWFTLIFMPALTLFVGLILKIFNVGCTDIVLTIMAGFTTFLGTILGISNVNYNKSAEKNIKQAETIIKASNKEK